VGAVILASIYWVFGFLRMGTSGLVAQSHGAGDAGESGAHLVRALGIGLVAGLVLIAAQAPLVAGAFRLAPASAEVETLARQYLAIRVWGAPFTIGMYALTGWMIAVERTRAILGVQMLINVINITLDLVFVLGLGWGVQGVAVATLIAESCGFALAAWLARDATRAGLAHGGLWAGDVLRRMVAVNGDIMIRSVLLQASFTTFVFLGAGQGDVTLAANQVLMQFLEITAYALDGFAFAAESLVGQAVGARRPDRVRRAAVLTSQWGVGGALAMGLVFAAGGGAIIDLLTTSLEVRAAARDSLPWLILAPVIGIASWMFDGIFIGATRTREMRIAMIQSVAVYVVALLVLPPLMGNHGLWAALMILNATRGLAMARLYPRVERAAAAA
ncbi:MATE family efflux transporter, partial [Paracoccus sanguinis]|uniref:MATE family efflux transporter n=1 Tax=Paracoccus sanguinis TaxID=1545044 RepID=UPI00051FC84F